MTLKNKRYFWIQLTQDFFKSKEMKLLRKIAGGDTHTIIYLKMMLISLEDGGRIYYDGLGDNLAEELSLVIDENIEDIKITLIFLESKGLLTKKSDRDYFLEQVPEMVGSETASARRVRKFRENKLALQCNNDETKRNGDIDKEIDIDTDKEVINKEIEAENTKRPRRKFIKPTAEEIEAFAKDQDLRNLDAQYFYNYYESNGWMVGKNHMKDWKATAKNWNRRELKNKTVIKMPDYMREQADAKTFRELEEEGKCPF